MVRVGEAFTGGGGSQALLETQNPRMDNPPAQQIQAHRTQRKIQDRLSVDLQACALPSESLEVPWSPQEVSWLVVSLKRMCRAKRCYTVYKPVMGPKGEVKRRRPAVGFPWLMSLKFEGRCVFPVNFRV